MMMDQPVLDSIVTRLITCTQAVLCHKSGQEMKAESVTRWVQVLSQVVNVVEEDEELAKEHLLQHQTTAAVANLIQVIHHLCHGCHGFISTLLGQTRH